VGLAWRKEDIDVMLKINIHKLWEACRMPKHDETLSHVIAFLHNHLAGTALIKTCRCGIPLFHTLDKSPWSLAAYSLTQQG
jgi:hypothetical protein